MTKPDKLAEKVAEKKSEAPDPLAKVRVRFTKHHTHAGHSYAPGDEAVIESHWAESIERLGTGHRISDTESKE